MKKMDTAKLMKYLGYGSKLMMALGALASLGGALIDDKRHTIEMKAEVKKEVAEMLRKGGS